MLILQIIGGIVIVLLLGILYELGRIWEKLNG